MVIKVDLGPRSYSIVVAAGALGDVGSRLRELRVGSRTALVSDAAEIYDWAARRADIDPARIALHGRSLGTGVAVQLAAARPARCVILTSPFASALDVAKEVYPWLPVGLLMRHRFDSAAHAPKLTMPALFLMGDADTLIPKHHSERLAGLWGLYGPYDYFAVEWGYGPALRKGDSLALNILNLMVLTTLLTSDTASAESQFNNSALKRGRARCAANWCSSVAMLVATCVESIAAISRRTMLMKAAGSPVVRTAK